MGYILPITQFQSKDYQSRVTETKQDIYDVEKPFKAFLNTKQSSGYDEQIQKENERQVAYYHATPLKNHELDQTIANITGKGSRFNEMV